MRTGRDSRWYGARSCGHTSLEMEEATPWIGVPRASEDRQVDLHSQRSSRPRSQPVRRQGAKDICLCRSTRCRAVIVTTPRTVFVTEEGGHVSDELVWGRG